MQRQAHLYYRNGSADKVYQVGINPVEDGFLVEFAYGRRGSALKAGTKTASPVSQEEAVKIFNKLVQSKKAKGYTEDESGEMYSRSERADEVSGVQCQLLNPIEADEALVLCTDPAFCAQQKHDGERRLVRILGSEVAGINRKGLFVGGMSTAAVDAFRALGVESLLVDCEDMGVRYEVFDLLELNGVDYRPLPYRERLMALKFVMQDADGQVLGLIETAYSEGEKKVLMEGVRCMHGEGVVYKRLDAPYIPGRPNSGGDQLKHKFYRSCTAIVESRNGDRRSVALSLLDDQGERVAVGNCTIPPNYLIPAEGACAEIRYLYAYRGGSLYQPQYCGERGDIEPSECVMSQLIYKPVAA